VPRSASSATGIQYADMPKTGSVVRIVLVIIIYFLSFIGNSHRVTRRRRCPMISRRRRPMISPVFWTSSIFIAMIILSFFPSNNDE